MIDTALPPGTPRPTVKHFLESKGWVHSEEGSTIVALVRDAEQNFLIRTDIQIQFHFDSKDQLVSYDLKDFSTGP